MSTDQKKLMLPDPMHRFTEVEVLDEPGAGGAYHEYEIRSRSARFEPQRVTFQKGPVLESGTNGIFIEDLMSICIHRLQCFQNGDFACRENALALTKLQEAMHWLNHRTRDRQARGAEGTATK